VKRKAAGVAKATPAACTADQFGRPPGRANGQVRRHTSLLSRYPGVRQRPFKTSALSAALHGSNENAALPAPPTARQSPGRSQVGLRIPPGMQLACCPAGCSTGRCIASCLTYMRRD